MNSSVIFLIEHKVCENAIELRKSLNSWLLELYGLSFEDILSTFAFVTDCAATMPCIARASLSSNNVPFCEKWVGCISHQLNTAIKKAMLLEDTEGLFISEDVVLVKSIVKGFKQSEMNAKVVSSCPGSGNPVRHYLSGG